MLQGLLSPALSGSPEGPSGWSLLRVAGRELFSQWRQHLCRAPLGMMQQRGWGSMPVCLTGAGAGPHALSRFTDLPLLRAFMCYALEQVFYQPKSWPLFFNSFICCSAEWNSDTKKNWIPLLYEGKLSENASKNIVRKYSFGKPLRACSFSRSAGRGILQEMLPFGECCPSGI